MLPRNQLQQALKAALRTTESGAKTKVSSCSMQPLCVEPPWICVRPERVESRATLSHLLLWSCLEPLGVGLVVPELSECLILAAGYRTDGSLLGKTAQNSPLVSFTLALTRCQRRASFRGQDLGGGEHHPSTPGHGWGTSGWYPAAPWLCDGHFSLLLLQPGC